MPCTKSKKGVILDVVKKGRLKQDNIIFSMWQIDPHIWYLPIFLERLWHIISKSLCVCFGDVCLLIWTLISSPLSSSETLFTPKDISTKRKIWKTFHGDANVCKNRMHWGRREILEYWIARSDTAPAEDTTSCGIVSKHFDWEFKLSENMQGQETNWLDKENVARENVRADIKTFVALINLWIPIPLCFLYRDRSVKWKRDLKELDPRIINFHWRTCYHSCSGN